MSADRRIEAVPLRDLRAWAPNPKAHDVAAIAASIRARGFAVPVVVDARTGLLAAGHGRVAALRALADAGEPRPRGIGADASGGWTVPVLVGWSSRDDAEAAAYAVADNRLCELGGWDPDALSAVLSRLALLGDDGLAGVGFSAEDASRLARDAARAAGEAEARARAEAAASGAAPASYRCPKCRRAWLGGPRPAPGSVADAGPGAPPAPISAADPDAGGVR